MHIWVIWWYFEWLLHSGDGIYFEQKKKNYSHLYLQSQLSSMWIPSGWVDKWRGSYWTWYAKVLPILVEFLQHPPLFALSKLRDKHPFVWAQIRLLLKISAWKELTHVLSLSANKICNKWILKQSSFTIFGWYTGNISTSTNNAFHLCFKLMVAPNDQKLGWAIEFVPWLVNSSYNRLN